MSQHPIFNSLPIFDDKEAAADSAVPAESAIDLKHRADSVSSQKSNASMDEARAATTDKGLPFKLLPVFEQ